MKAILIYIALAAVAVNIGANMAANTAEGIKAAQEARIERLCEVNDLYCS